MSPVKVQVSVGAEELHVAAVLPCESVALHLRRWGTHAAYSTVR